MKVRTTYLIAAGKQAAYFVVLVVIQFFLGAKGNMPVYIHAGFVVAELLLAWFAFKNWRAYQRIPEDDKTEEGWEMAERYMGPEGWKFVWLALGAGVAVLAISWPRGEHYYPVGLFVAPMLVLLGIGGLVDRRVMVGMRKDRPEVTPGIRKASIALTLTGLAIGGLLVYCIATGRF